MKIKLLAFLFAFFFCIGLISCRKQAPQLPSNKGIETNKNATSLLVINHDLAIREDSILKILAERKGTFKKNELGFWYQISNSGNGSIIKDSVVCEFEFSLTKLDEEVLQTGKNKIVIGKKQVVTGLEEGLKLMHKGDSAIFIIPWYLGYGRKGNEQVVPAYTSIIYRINHLN